jgi:hypothetical protein
MSQSTAPYSISNVSGAQFRADVNTPLTAIASLNPGTVAPSPTFANMFWADLGNTLLKQRNTANSAWVTLGTLDAANLGHATLSGAETLTNKVLSGGTLSGSTTLPGSGSIDSAGRFTLGAVLNEAQGANIAAAATVDIGSATGNFVIVTGANNITALGTAQAGAEREVRFSGAPTLFHNATSLILPNAQNVYVEAGDTAKFRSLGSGNWVCTGYRRAIPLLAASVARTGSNQTGVVSATWTKVQYGTEVYDFGSKYDNATNYRWTPGRVGVARISARVGWNTMADGAPLGIAVYRNGSTVREHYEPAASAAGGGVNGPMISVDVQVNAVTDYFEIFVYQGSGSDRDILGFGATTWATFHMLPME